MLIRLIGSLCQLRSFQPKVFRHDHDIALPDKTIGTFGRQLHRDAVRARARYGLQLVHAKASIPPHQFLDTRVVFCSVVTSSAGVFGYCFCECTQIISFLEVITSGMNAECANGHSYRPSSIELCT